MGFVEKATSELGLPALPSEIIAANSKAIAGLGPQFVVRLSHYLPKYARSGELIRYKADGKRTSHYAPKGWTGALPPELPATRAALLRSAIGQLQEGRSDTPFTTRELSRSRLRPSMRAIELASGISALVLSGHLVRVGAIAGHTLFLEKRVYDQLSSRKRANLVETSTSSPGGVESALTLVGALEVIANRILRARNDKLSVADQKVIAARPLTAVDFRHALAKSEAIGPLRVETLSRAIASATSQPRRATRPTLRCIGSAGSAHFYAIGGPRYSAYVDYRFAEYHLNQLLDCFELNELLLIKHRGAARSGFILPKVVGAARLAEFAARIQCRREQIEMMPWCDLLLSTEHTVHLALVHRSRRIEDELRLGVKFLGGDAIQLLLYTPDIPDDGALLTTTAIERAAELAGLVLGRSARLLSGTLARKLGGVERVVSARLDADEEGIRLGGRDRVYLRRSRTLCHLLKKCGGPTWHAIANLADSTMGDLSDSGVFVWLLQVGSDHEMMLGAACLAILDTSAARNALGHFLLDQRTVRQRASAAFEFAIIGLGRKPLLPREFGLEHEHERILRELKAGSNRRTVAIASWALESWKPETAESRRLAF